MHNTIENMVLSPGVINHVTSFIPKHGTFTGGDITEYTGRAKSTVNTVLSDLERNGYLRIVTPHDSRTATVWTHDGCPDLPTSEVVQSTYSRQAWRKLHYQEIVDAIRSGDPGWLFKLAAKQHRSPGAILQTINNLEVKGITIDDLATVLEVGLDTGTSQVEFINRIKLWKEDRQRAKQKTLDDAVAATRSDNGGASIVIPQQLPLSGDVPPVTMLIERVTSIALTLSQLTRATEDLQSKIGVDPPQTYSQLASSLAITKNQMAMLQELLVDFRKEEIAHYKKINEQVGFLSGQVSTLMVSLGVSRARQ